MGKATDLDSNPCKQHRNCFLSPQENKFLPSPLPLPGLVYNPHLFALRNDYFEQPKIYKNETKKIYISEIKYCQWNYSEKKKDL